MKIKNKSTRNKTELKNLNKMGDRKNLTKNAEELGCEHKRARTITIGLCANFKILFTTLSNFKILLTTLRLLYT